MYFKSTFHTSLRCESFNPFVNIDSKILDMGNMSRCVLYFRTTGKSPFEKLNYKNKSADIHLSTEMIKINHDFFFKSNQEIDKILIGLL